MKAVMKKFKTCQLQLLMKQLACCYQQSVTLTCSHRVLHNHANNCDETRSHTFPTLFCETKHLLNHHMQTTLANAKPVERKEKFMSNATSMKEKNLNLAPLDIHNFCGFDSTNRHYPFSTSETFLAARNSCYDVAFPGML